MWPDSIVQILYTCAANDKKYNGENGENEGDNVVRPVYANFV